MNVASFAGAVPGALAPGAHAARGHAVCGPRIFPVTLLTLEDPGVVDEASIPTFSWQRSGAEGGPGPVNLYAVGVEYDKRITTNLGIPLNYGWTAQNTAHEVTWTSRASAPGTIATAWMVAPGVIYQGDSFQPGVEALIPANRADGSNVGVIAQFQLFFDDLFPNSLGRPIAEWFQ